MPFLITVGIFKVNFLLYVNCAIKYNLNLYFDCQAWNGQIKGYRVLFVPFPHHAQPSQSKLNTARLSAVIGTTTALTGPNCHRMTKKGN